jgi:hypothetical protein
MAVGDEASSAGLPLVPTTGEEGRVRWGAREINRTRDFVAQVKSALVPLNARKTTVAGSTIDNANSSGMVIIHYGVTFKTAPIVVACCADDSNPSIYVVAIETPARDMCTMYLWNVNGARMGAGNKRINWIAVGDI